MKLRSTLRLGALLAWALVTCGPLAAQPRAAAPAATTTTLKLPNKLKVRVSKLAKKHGRTPHGLMVEAIEREIDKSVDDAVVPNRKFAE